MSVLISNVFLFGTVFTTETQRSHRDTETSVSLCKLCVSVVNLPSKRPIQRDDENQRNK